MWREGLYDTDEERAVFQSLGYTWNWGRIGGKFTSRRQPYLFIFLLVVSRVHYNTLRTLADPLHAWCRHLYCTHAHMLHARTDAHRHTCTHARTHAHTHACMHSHTHTHTPVTYCIPKSPVSFLSSWTCCCAICAYSIAAKSTRQVGSLATTPLDETSLNCLLLIHATETWSYCLWVQSHSFKYCSAFACCFSAHILSEEYQMVWMVCR